jgi:hypothetical protein
MEIITARQDHKNIPARLAWTHLLQWVGLLGGPIAWLLNLQITYPLVKLACAWHRNWPLHVANIVFLLLAAGAGALAFSLWRAPGEDQEEFVLDRARFMSMLGMLNGALFFLVILSQSIPNFILDPCRC